MAAIEIKPTKSRRSGKGFKRHSQRIDMTPMVDLGFLLITFFVFTAKLSEPVSLTLNMPKETDKPTPVGESTALTVLLDDGRLFYYEGDWESAINSGQVRASSFDPRGGIGEIIRRKQAYLHQHPVDSLGAAALMLLIKPTPASSYRELMALLDETLINRVSRHAITGLSDAEKAFLASRNP